MGQEKIEENFWMRQVANPLIFLLAGLLIIGGAVLAIDRFERQSLAHYDHIQDTTSGALPTPEQEGQTAGVSTPEPTPDSHTTANQASTHTTHTVTRNNNSVTTTHNSRTTQGQTITTPPSTPTPAPSPQPSPTPAPTPPPPPPGNGGGILEPVCGILPILC